jgi:predicted amidohydrolase
MKIAVASPPYPNSLAEALNWIEKLAGEAADKGAEIVCFPETYLPGYPLNDSLRPEPSDGELKASLKSVCIVAKEKGIAITIPMDWYEGKDKLNVAHIVSKTGELLGYQTKNQLDPSEDAIWTPGSKRTVFEIDGLKFGVVICHEGFRYPESVRWLARNGAQVVFHPNFTGSDKEGKEITEWGDRESPYYEKAQMMRALENTIYFASSNYCVKFPESASSIIAPDGRCVAYQQYGVPGIAVADIDLNEASSFLAKRFKPELYS